MVEIYLILGIGRDSLRSHKLCKLINFFHMPALLASAKGKGWLVHFGLLKNDLEWNHIYVSGHGSGDQIKEVIEGSKPKTLVPIHTEHEEYHKKWHDQVKEVQLNGSIFL